MDLRTLISLVSVMLSAVLNTVASAPASDAPAASLVSHVRNKRCSCATLLDKECVYFCHLDIIWVNTPERVVSYGLGNTQRRRRRSVGGSGANRAGSRCTCLRGHDSTCNNFCQPQHRLRYNKATPRAQGEGCSGAGCARTPTAAAARMKRRSNATIPASPVALRGVAKARAVLQAWRRRRRRGVGEKEEKEEHVAS